MTNQASPTKLRDGSWGTKVYQEANPGDVFTVTTRAGKSWDVEIIRVLWTGKDKWTGKTVSLCKSSKLSSHFSNNGYGWNGGRRSKMGSWKQEHEDEISIHGYSWTPPRRSQKTCCECQQPIRSKHQRCRETGMGCYS